MPIQRIQACQLLQGELLKSLQCCWILTLGHIVGVFKRMSSISEESRTSYISLKYDYILSIAVSVQLT